MKLRRWFRDCPAAIFLLDRFVAVGKSSCVLSLSSSPRRSSVDIVESVSSTEVCCAVAVRDDEGEVTPMAPGSIIDDSGVSAASECPGASVGLRAFKAVIVIRLKLFHSSSSSFEKYCTVESLPLHQ